LEKFFTKNMQLHTIPTIILSSEKTRHRQHRILTMLADKCWQHVTVLTAAPSKPYWLGCLRNMRTALQCPAPFIMLEDDATFTTSHPILTIDPPKDAAAIYLGTTPHGVPIKLNWPWIAHHTPTAWTPLWYQPHNRHYIRVGNMLSTHAILILTNDAARWMRNILKAHEPTDVTLGRHLHEQKIYARTSPIFYQQDGHNDDPTKQPLATLKHSGYNQ
jgi:hypothetical protein